MNDFVIATTDGDAVFGNNDQASIVWNSEHFKDSQGHNWPVNPAAPPSKPLPSPTSPLQCAGLCPVDDQWVFQASGTGSYDTGFRFFFPGVDWNRSDQYTSEFQTTLTASSLDSNTVTEGACFYIQATLHFLDVSVPPEGWSFDQGGFMSCTSYPL